MKFRNILIVLLIATVFVSCSKNTVSNIPHIDLQFLYPDSIRVNKDTAFLKLSFQDGDADLGVDQNSGKYDIYIKDLRYDSSGYLPYLFPVIDKTIEDSKIGITGTCIFKFLPGMIVPRVDTPHLLRDTTSFEVYIVDRAGNESNHIITTKIIIRR